MLKSIGAVLLVIVLVLALVWLIQGADFFLFKFFAPKYEQVRRDAFEQSKAYNQGMEQELNNMMFEYIQADDTAKMALRSVILHRVADYDINLLNADLRLFIQKLRAEVK